ncbi:prolyl aminopeptidase [Nitzschia inconspicua]|uniref:Prolyl aminopeptidase n=1 Tax=Nitzschia inconspicua TaxID=303405 RepID=A0A9K3K4V5_9STRA|nr:prolyl aminopeptidase [Nitzschia inconspicua]KAG7361949.1 prolyl aminopeptidase [Nitzschia inconspicua]
MREITRAFVRVIGGVAVIFSPMDTFRLSVSAWTVSIGSSVPTRRRSKLVSLSRMNPMMSSSKTESETTSKSASESLSSSSSLRELYPPWNSNLSDCCHYENGTLSVENGFHTLYYQVYSSGKNTTTTSDDAVALFLHGGPGAGCFPNHVRFFNPQRYAKVILLDQRGCGQSYAQETTKLHHFNTLQHLISDIETLRQHLQIHQWTTILGGSWGSTLALAYAQEYPHRVYSLILRGICTMRQSEIDWLFGTGGGASQLFPESFQQFEETVAVVDTTNTNSPKDTTNDPTKNALKEYHRAFFMEISSTTNVSDTIGTEPNTTTALQSWRRWESLMTVAHKLLPAMSTQPALNLSDQSAVMKTLFEWDTNYVESPVVVGTTTSSTSNRNDKSIWTFQDANGKIVPTSATSTQSAE